MHTAKFSIASEYKCIPSFKSISFPLEEKFSLPKFPCVFLDHTLAGSKQFTFYGNIDWGRSNLPGLSPPHFEKIYWYGIKFFSKPRHLDSIKCHLIAIANYRFCYVSMSHVTNCSILRPGSVKGCGLQPCTTSPVGYQGAQ